MKNCSSIYLDCWNGVGNLAACPPGSLFHPDTKKCESIINGKCAEYYDDTENDIVPRTTTKAPSVLCDVGTADGIYEHPFDCTKFIQCANGRTFIQNCAPRTHFNAVLQVCDHIANSICNNNSGKI